MRQLPVVAAEFVQTPAPSVAGVQWTVDGDAGCSTITSPRHAPELRKQLSQQRLLLEELLDISGGQLLQ